MSDGGSAFPRTAGTMDHVDQEGMTLRDWFAGQALAGICSRLDAELVKRWMDGHADGRECVVAYLIADEMLTLRDQT